MKNCDYEITYYRDGNPKVIRVPALEVDENLTADELDLSLKSQIKDLFKTALLEESHILHETVVDLTKAGVIFQGHAISRLPSSLLNTEVGVLVEASKTEYDGNVKLADLKAHLDTATHPYKGLLNDILADEDLTLPMIHLIAEKYNSTGNPEDDIDSAFGVYIKGDNGIDTIKVYAGEKAGDLDVLNTDHQVAKVLAHELVHLKTSRKLGEWYNKDRKGFNDTFKPIIDDIYNSMMRTFPPNSGHYRDIALLITNDKNPLSATKELFAYTLTDGEFAKKLNYIESSKGKTVLENLFNWIKDLLGVKIRNGSVLQTVLNQYENLQYLKSDPKTEEDPIQPSTDVNSNDPEFARIIDPFIYQQVADLPAYDESQTLTANGKIWRNFFEATQNEFARYSINYSDPVQSFKGEETIASNDAALFRLKQNDIIRYHKMKKEGDTWVKDLTKVGYSPIIYNYYNKNLGQTFFVVATQEGPRHVAKDNIFGYRKYYGNIRTTAAKVPSSVVKQIIEKKKEVRDYFKDKRLNPSIFEDVTLYKNNHKFQVWKAKDNSAFFLEGMEARLYFHDLAPNDLVQVRKYNEDLKAKKEFNYFTVVRVLGSAVEVLDRNNQLRLIEKKMLQGVLLLEENHGNIVADYKEEFGNGRNKQVMDYFYNIKQEFKLNYSNDIKLSELQKNNLPIPPELEYMLFKNKQNLVNEDGDFVDTKAFTSLKDVYDLELFSGDENPDYKLKKIGNLERGSIVLLKPDNEDYNYVSAIVLDFDEITGTPIVGTKIRPSKPRIVKLANGTYSTTIPSPFYKTESAEISNIIGIGVNLIDNPDIDIYADKATIRKIEASRKDFLKSKEYMVFDTPDAANEYKAQKDLHNFSIATQYVLKDGKITFIKPDATNFEKSRYVLKHDTTGDLRRKFTPYRYISNAAISANSTQDLWDDISVGDLIKKRYSTQEGNRYFEGVVIKKTPGSIVIESSWVNPKTQEIGRSHSTYFVGKDALKGKGLRDITSIGFSFKGRENVDAISNRYNKIAITGSPDTVLKKDQYTDPISFSKEFSTEDQKTYRKSPKTSDKLMEALTNNLQRMYGIQINLMDSQEISDTFDLNPNAPLLYSQQRAFVLDNQIYINTDKASLAEPIHEMGHIILQGLKASNNSLYQSILSKFAAHPQFDNIAKYYPELDQNAATEEVFVTTLGEMFNGTVGNKLTNKWENDNKSFLSKVFSSIKNFLSELFGINKKSFFDISDYELMNMSFNDIHAHFGNSILNGDFTALEEIRKIKEQNVSKGSYLRSDDGEKSTLYTHLKALDFTDNEASNLWLKTKTDSFKQWSGDTLITNEVGEPELFVRQDDPLLYTRAGGVVDPTKLVYIKGSVTENGNTFKVLSPNQAKGIFSVGSVPRTSLDIDPFIKFATMMGIKTEGTPAELARSLPQLREAFPGYEYEIQEAFGESYITRYPTPSEEIRMLRAELIKNNNLNMKC